MSGDATSLSPGIPSLAAAAGTLPSGLWHRTWDHCSSAKPCCCGAALPPEIVRCMVCVGRKIYERVAALLMLGAVRPGGRLRDGGRRCSGLLG